MQALIRRPDTGYLGNWLWVPKTSIDYETVKRGLSMKFVDSYAEHKFRFVYLYRETETHLLVPRKLWDPGSLPFRVVDCRPRTYERTGVTSRIKLDHRLINGQLVPTGEDVQQRAMEALLKTDSGILQLGCGKGKTVVALDYIARTGGPALIVVDNTHLLEQWENAIKNFLDVPGGIGKVQGKTFDWKKGVVLATYQTLGALAYQLGEDFKQWFMTVIYDEGHHISAQTFAPSAEVIYGRRIALTATAIRDDGLHVIYDNHVGGTIYKDITHHIKPRIIFKWTGLDVPPSADVLDRNGELHLSKVSSYFGKWGRRMAIILNDVDAAVQAGRKVLVLSNSVDEAVNLCSLWTRRSWWNPDQLYSDIPIPTPAEVGATVPPIQMTQKQITATQAQLEKLEKDLAKPHTDRIRQSLMDKAAEYEMHLLQAEAHKKISSMLSARQKEYRTWLTDNLTDAGLMIHAVDAKKRFGYIETKRVVFAITKYGREGLDDEWLDTVLICTPFSKRNTLQQVIGRPTRQKPGKKTPLVVFYEDNVGPLIGMCRKLRGHLNSWPMEENGPFEYELHGHPKARQWNQTAVFGQ